MLPISILSCSNRIDENKLHVINNNGKLTKEEYDIIFNKNTERPFSGRLLHTSDTGEYLCKSCGNPLFASDAKFDSGTGWPSFDQSIEGAVEYVKDGSRTEIVCANCGGHLGHIFYGECFTDKNARYCVNSLSLDFNPISDDK